MDSSPAFNEMLAHRAFVRSVAQHLGRDASSGEDLEQEVWVQVLQAPPRHNQGLRTWLWRIMQSRSSSVHRDAQRRDERHQRAATLRGEPVVHPEEDSSELSEKLQHALSTLSSSDQEILRLRYFEDSTFNDIAGHLQLSAETVRTRQRRALQQMRINLERNGIRDPKEWFSGLLFGWRPSQTEWSLGALIKPLAWLACLILPVALYFGMSREDQQPSLVANMTSHPVQTSDSSKGRSPAAGLLGDSALRRATRPGPDAGTSATNADRAETLDAEIVVFDRHGQPCANAEILLSGPDDVEPRTVLGVTDGEGRCQLAGVPAGHWLAASSQEFRTRAILLQPPSNDSSEGLQIKLKLHRAARKVAGTVLDPDGRPLANATVSLGRSERFVATRSSSRLLSMPPLIQVQTDANGAFLLRHSWHRNVPLEIVHEDFARTIQMLSPASQQVPPIHMSVGCALYGSVRSTEPGSTEGTVVWLQDPYLGTVATTRTDSAGYFHFEKIPAGSYRVIGAGTVDARAAVGEEMVQLLVGPPAQVDLLLSPGAGIAGHAADEDGSPLHGWWVAAFNCTTKAFETRGSNESTQLSPVWAQVDSNGQFSMHGCTDPVYQLRLYESRRLTEHPRARLDDVYPGQQSSDLNLGPTASEACTGSLEIRSVPTEIVTQGRLWLSTPWCPIPLMGTVNPAGNYHFEGLGPGQLTVWASQLGRPPRTLAQIEMPLGGHVQHSLEPSPQPGFIDLSVLGLSQDSRGRLKFQLVLEGRRGRPYSATRKSQDNSLRVTSEDRLQGELEPGDYLISVLARGGMANARVHIQSGETYVGHVTLSPSGPHPILIHLPPPLQPNTDQTGELWIDLMDEEGELRFTLPAIELSASRETMFRMQPMPIGTWEARIYLRRHGLIEAEGSAAWIVGQTGTE
ncbi:MAG: RNA polymerase sigma factor (sigma-70 family), partial [Candidatus Paceibacteria bacterium]